MKTNLYVLLLLIGLGIPSKSIAQSGFLMPAQLDHIDIPFEYVNNFIIVTILFNRTLPLKMIFDTGAEHTIFTKREISDLMKVKYDKEFHLVGADMKTELVAYLVRQVRLEALNLPVVAQSENILVLKEDYFRFEEYAGVNVHGILSAQSFAQYIFKINYQKKVITLYSRKAFGTMESGYQKVPVEIFRNKVYLQSTAELQPDSTAKIKLLLDTGAALPLLLFNNTHPLVHPPGNAITSNIGMGLGGYLAGYIGRIEGLQMGNFQQKGIVTYFQALDTSLDLSYLNNRNGLIGNIVLSRFFVILDYQGAALYLKPSKTYPKIYVFDRSGLQLIAGGTALNKFIVQGVAPNSPAAEAGFAPGDRILKVGFWPASFYGLDDIQKVLKKAPNKKITLTIRRDGQKMRKTLVLRDLI